MIQTFLIPHYRKTDSAWLINGGRLTVTDRNITLIMPLGRSASFRVSELRVSVKPDYVFFKTLRLADSRNSYELYLSERTFCNLCDILGSMNLLIL